MTKKNGTTLDDQQIVGKESLGCSSPLERRYFLSSSLTSTALPDLYKEFTIFSLIDDKAKGT